MAREPLRLLLLLLLRLRLRLGLRLGLWSRERLSLRLRSWLREWDRDQDRERERECDRDRDRDRDRLERERERRRWLRGQNRSTSCDGGCPNVGRDNRWPCNCEHGYEGCSRDRRRPSATRPKGEHGRLGLCRTSSHEDADMDALPVSLASTSEALVVRLWTRCSAWSSLWNYPSKTSLQAVCTTIRSPPNSFPSIALIASSASRVSS